MKKQFLEAGKIVRTHGVRGELVLECWADSPEFLAGLKHLYFDGGSRDAGLVSSRVHKGRVLLKLQGVDTVEQGERWTAIRAGSTACCRKCFPPAPTMCTALWMGPEGNSCSPR